MRVGVDKNQRNFNAVFCRKRCVLIPKNVVNLDVQIKVNQMGWRARKADGSRVLWTVQGKNLEAIGKDVGHAETGTTK